MTNKEHRTRARQALENQWGRNAGITFLSILITGIIGGIFESVADFPQGSIQDNILNFLIATFLTFAFTAAMYYIALYVLRGGKAEPGMLFIAFQGKYYLPLLLINVARQVVGYLFGLLVYLPFLITAGTGFYFAMVFGNGVNNLSNSISIGDVTFAILLAVAAVLLLIVTMIFDGYFQFVVWAKLDFPQLKLGDGFRYGWRLIKGRFIQYLLLQLSFIGWYFLAMLSLGIGIFFVVPYQNVAVASLYDDARQTMGDPLI